MAQITEKSITEAVLKLDNLSEDALEKLSETYTLEQEIFVGYILSSAIEYENDELLDYLLYYYNIFSEAIKTQGVNLKKIDESVIDEFQGEYISTLDEFMETDDEDLINSLCNQPMMLSFFVNDIFGEDQNGEKLEEGLANELFLVGVAMISLMNRAMIES
ncbi:MAG TPA: hypothetical protein VKX31_09745 [Brumimicrobium sp.]|nr:hypothetical protein [Brumimicrobium sp.]